MPSRRRRSGSATSSRPGSPTRPTRRRSGFCASTAPSSTASRPLCSSARRFSATSCSRCSATWLPSRRPARPSARSGSSPPNPTAGSIAGVQARAIHHVGIAVEDLDEAVDTYERFFGGELEGRGTISGQRVEAASLVLGSGRVELVAALHEDSTVARFIATRGPGMHHIAYEVDDVQSALDGLAEQGAQLIDSEPREGLFGLQVAFVHPESVHGVLSEVVSSGG